MAQEQYSNFWNLFGVNAPEPGMPFASYIMHSIVEDRVLLCIFNDSVVATEMQFGSTLTIDRQGEGYRFTFTAKTRENFEWSAPTFQQASEELKEVIRRHVHSEVGGRVFTGVTKYLALFMDMDKPLEQRTFFVLQAVTKKAA